MNQLNSMKFGKEHIEEIDVQVKSMQEYRQTKVDEYLQNKNNSLEDRWEVWTKYSEDNLRSSIHKFPEDIFPELDVYVHYSGSRSRGSIITYKDVVKSMLNLLDDTYTHEVDIFNHETMNDLKKYLMKENLRSYKFDW